MTKFLAGGVAATMAVAAPAGAATFEFDFTSLRGGTLQTNGLINAGNGGMGNVRSRTVHSGGESLTLRATGFPAATPACRAARAWSATSAPSAATS